MWFKQPIRVVFLFFSVFMLFGALTSVNIYETVAQMRIALILSGVVFVGLCFFAVFRKKPEVLNKLKQTLFSSKKRRVISAAIFCAAIVVYQSVLILSIHSRYGFDPDHMAYLVWMSYFRKARYAKDMYLSYYPDNHFLYLVMYWVSKITERPHGGVYDLLNMFCIDFSILITALAAGKKYGKRNGYIALIIGGFVLGFSPTVLVFYTDTAVLPFVSVGLLFIAYYDTEVSFRKHATKGFILGLMAAFTYWMKPSAVIPYIAAAIVFLLATVSKTFRKESKERDTNASEKQTVKTSRLENINKEKSIFVAKAAILVIICSLTFLGANSAFRGYIGRQTIFTYDEDLRFPPTHFVMMGLSQPVGGFCVEDYYATLDAGSYDEKIAFHITEISKRLDSFGFVGYVEFLGKKLVANTSDGTFFFRGEGESATLAYLKSEAWFTNLVGSFYFRDGSNYDIYRLYSQLVWLVVLIGVLLSARDRDMYTDVLRLAVIGGMVYLLLFEGGRSRYLIQFLPFIIILSTIGLSSVREHFQKRVEHKPASG
jgi:hypothetical protein